MYEPEVNDYVIWKRPNSDNIDEGWVYFKGDKCNKDINNNCHPRYLTIETGIRLKPECETTDKLQIKKCKLEHKYIHTLLLCYEQDWIDLKYVHSRQNAHSTEYFRRAI